MIAIIAAIVQVYTLLIIARALGSFFVRDWSSGIPRFLFEVTEPVLAPVRRLIPPIGGVLDISPMLVIIAMQFVLGLIAPGAGGFGFGI
ncbi:MAG: YggT family protein [Candidatus Dormiibacterota bacterium]